MILLDSQPGVVVALDDAGIQGSARIANFDAEAEIGLDFDRSIITGLTVSQEVNVQFLHTLGSYVYIYVFGDRMGAVSISGISFAANCDDDFTQAHGLELMIQWYRQFRASRRQDPIRVMVGNTPIEGFVTGITNQVVDPQTGLVQWTINTRSLPDN